MNAINVIAPYKHHGQWVFDDPRVGLSQDLLLLAPIPGSTVWWLIFPMLSKASRLSFRVRHFQGINTVSIGGARKAAATGINSADLDMEGWLCPALFRYFTDAPKTLYAQIKPRS